MTNDKEKQLTSAIEKVLSDTQNCGISIETLTDYLVNRIKDKVVPNDSVVVPKEEYDCLKKMEATFDPFWFCTFGGCEGAHKECKNTCEMSIFVKERMKTSKEIFDTIIKVLEDQKERVKAFYGVAESVGADVAIRTVKDLAKRFGVEIKEQ